MAKQRTREQLARECEALRAQGKTYAEIAKVYGLSTQYINQMMARYKVSQFRPLTDEQCVFVGLRCWMNENKCSMAELARRRFGFFPGGTSMQGWRSKMHGGIQLKKDDIDKLIEITGMSYEELFREVANGAEQ